MLGAKSHIKMYTVAFRFLGVHLTLSLYNDTIFLKT